MSESIINYAVTSGGRAALDANISGCYLSEQIRILKQSMVLGRLPTQPLPPKMGPEDKLTPVQFRYYAERIADRVRNIVTDLIVSGESSPEIAKSLTWFFQQLHD